MFEIITFLLIFFNSNLKNVTPGKIIYHDEILGNFIYVPPTSPEGFVQGSPPNEKCRRKNEKQFIHVLTKHLAVMETEVTSKMWDKLSRKVKNFPPDPTDEKYGKGENNPVQNVTWRECILFSNEISKLNGLRPAYYSDKNYKNHISIENYLSSEVFWDKNSNGYRLPTEGEWEYIYRAGTKGAFYFDFPEYESMECFPKDKIPPSKLDNYAWHLGNSGGKTHPVKLLKPNAWGIYDLPGNVREWCWDKKGRYPEGKVIDYEGASEGAFRVVRGGAHNAFPRASRAANRYGGSETARGWGVGFRLVRTLNNEDLSKYSK